MSRLLIVDDDELTLQLYDLMFDGAEGIFLNKATSAAEAFSYLQNCPADQWPEIIFVDLHMQDMNGFEFVEGFKKDFASLLDETHLYILTSSVSPRDQEEVRKYPAISGLISKPLTEENLQKIINRNLKK